MLDVVKKKIYDSGSFQNINVPENNSEQFFIDGLRGSLRSFYIAYLVEVLKKPVVFISSEMDAAEKIRDDLELLLGKNSIVFFPSAEKSPYDDHEPNPSLQRLRLETLQSLLKYDNTAVVATVEGIMGGVPSPESFVDGQFFIEKNQHYPFDKLIENLHAAGYSRTDIVEDVGHFAVRGGIIDIFPWTSDDPVRLEFFGPAIESIRYFNIISQRSIEETSAIELLPAIHQDNSRNTIFDYLNAETVFVLEDFDILSEEGRQYGKVIQENYEKLMEEEVYPSPPESRYGLWDNLLLKLTGYRKIHFGLIADKNYSLKQFQSITPPTFAGHLNRLFSYLGKSKGEQIFTLIQCDTSSQAERLEEILRDEDLDIAANVAVGALHDGFVFPEGGIQVLTDHEIFDRFKKRRTYRRFKNGEYLRSLSALNLNDYVVHIQYGIGQYLGLQTIQVSNSKKECIKLQYADGDLLFVSVDSLNNVQKYASEEESIPALTRLNTGEWERIKKKTKESIEKVASELLELQAARKTQKGYTYSEDTHWQRELEASFPFEETEDQIKSIEEVKKDLQTDIPMDRLLCGDVGYGKTEVAIRAAFKVVMEGKQVVILVPTTILAHQHFQTFRERMSEFPVHVEMLSRFRTPKEQKIVLEKLASGEIDIIIGTHRLLSDDVLIKNIGLLIIDEEQRFGVKHKEKMKRLRVTVDVLTLTATPIPRTMHLALMGARDLSNIETPPRNRLPVITEIHEWDDDLIFQAINRELERHGQVYFVHNRVKTIKSLQNIIQEIVPSARIVIAHGQLPEKQLEKIMMDFIHKKYDILISTMIIENGLDIPNVNTILIDHADKFGLSQLYQLRGRVGRSDIQAYAYLIVPHASKLTDLAQKRLRAIQDFTDLGSGFKVALRDMEIRGIGNILGKEQSGNIQAVGFDLYCRLIDESVHKLKEIPGEETIEDLQRYTDTKIDVDFDLMIPAEYISSESERVSVYHKLVNYKNSDELNNIKSELDDRFGKIPESVNLIIDALELKILAGRIFAGLVRLKGNTFTIKFSEEAQNKEVFHQKIMPELFTMRHPPAQFTGDQSNPLVNFHVVGDTEKQRIEQAKNILQRIY